MLEEEAGRLIEVLRLWGTLLKGIVGIVYCSYTIILFWKMSSVSAEPPSVPMNCMGWSFFSDRAESYGSYCNDIKALHVRRSESLPGVNFYPQLFNSERARSRLLGGGLETEGNARESVCLGGHNCDSPDANSVEGLAFEPPMENFDGGTTSSSSCCGVSCIPIPKDGDGVRVTTVPVPSPPNNGSGVLVGSPGVNDAINALQKYLPCNNEDEERWPGVDAYSCDEFRMYEFKVRRCMRGRSHDWTECPFAHPGEKARRRDPRRFHYSGTACPDFRKGSCRRGDACEFAHGVFECWLHPARYRTQPCKDGRNCRRRVCFFAHTAEQLRLLTSQPPYQSSVGTRSALHASALKNSACGGSYDGSPLRHSLDGVGECGNHLGCLEAAGSPRGHMGYWGKASQVNFCSSVVSSPTSTLVGHSHSPPPLSPPLSPSGSPPLSPVGIPSSRGSVPVKGGYLKAILSPSSLAQVRTALSSGSQGVAGAAVTPGLNAPASSPVSATRRQLERLGTMPCITIPPSEPVSSPGPSILSPPVGCSQSSSPALQSSKVITELINSLQHLEVNGSAVSPWLQTQMDSGRNGLMVSNFRYCSQGSPYAMTRSGWAESNCEAELSEEPVQRVESGRDLRAKIYGRLMRDNVQEPFDLPDLGWVNELVK